MSQAGREKGLSRRLAKYYIYHSPPLTKMKAEHISLKWTHFDLGNGLSKCWVFLLGFNHWLFFLHNSWGLEYPKTTWLLWKYILQEIIDMTHCNACKDIIILCNQHDKLTNNQARDCDRQ